VPFAEAHEIAGACVRFCETEGMELTDLTAEELAGISPKLGVDVLSVLSVAGSINAKSGRGGTAEARVREQLAEVEADMDEARSWLDSDGL
jgi:argininosuccinate lyase